MRGAVDAALHHFIRNIENLLLNDGRVTALKDMDLIGIGLNALPDNLAVNHFFLGRMLAPADLAYIRRVLHHSGQSRATP